MIKHMKKIKLEDLQCVDGVYYVGHIIDVDGNPWVSKAMAEEALEIVNSHVDAFVESIFSVE